MAFPIRFSGLACALLVIFFTSCKTSQTAKTLAGTLQAEIDLVNVVDDKVSVSVKPGTMLSPRMIFRFPRIIPGTYAIADYGRYIEDFEARDINGKLLPADHPDVNTWVINGADKLSSVRYRVNDTYDNEGEGAFTEGSTTIFSPAGTNILAGQNFLLNMAGFVGYFDGLEQQPYQVRISHPAELQAASSMVDLDKSATVDLFSVSKYAEVVDHPVMYSKPDFGNARIQGMDVTLSVYSPRKKSITAAALMPDLERMMRAQKAYLGDINNTPRYAVLTYITSYGKDDARGIGALEHNTSTTAVFMENMKARELIHVISHEFFHTLTPLNVHSREIQYFNFSEPKMSAHLWMYEGFTEYFAQHFQVHQGLTSEDQFLDVMVDKIKNSRYFKDSLSFLHMSRNVLDPQMHAQYPNVYQKGALLAMCLDIILREQSGGKTGLLQFMKELSSRYGPDKPFDDDKFIPEVSAMMGREAADFIDAHIVKGIPVNYDDYFRKVGCTVSTIKVPSLTVFMKGTTPHLLIDTVRKKVTVNDPSNDNDFFKSIGIEQGDEILSINGGALAGKTPADILMTGVGIEEGETVTAQVKRGERILDLTGKARLNYADGKGYRFTDNSKAALKNAWLKN